MTRIEDLVVREVRTQYRISKIASHDAVLDVLAEDGIHVTYVNAEIEDGTEVSQLMKYFKTTDPEDMSQGELSKRIHFLKCEEGGLKVMCEMSEKWIEEGRAEGILVGGNLSLFSNLITGKYKVDTRDKILFIEDLGYESPPRNDKQLFIQTKAK